MTGDARVVEPLASPPDAVVRVPGSKSITNRALLCAALADGPSDLSGVLVADDSEAMVGCLTQLGVGLAFDRGRGDVAIGGAGGAWPAPGADLDARLSGTTSRFVLPALALGRGRFRLDGRAPLRARPFDDVVTALRGFGVEVEEGSPPGRLPLTVVATGGLDGGEVRVAADRTSQFVSALLLTAPYATGGLRLRLEGAVASRPYVELTRRVMADFGADSAWAGESTLVVPPGRYTGRRYAVEPDASSASYFLAAAAVTGGRVSVEGLGPDSPQGDARFVDVLERMGAKVERSAHRLTVIGGALVGIDVDLADQPDMAQTVAVTAVFADGPTRVRGVALIREHETDRIAAVVAELRRCGVDAEEHDDGFTIRPGPPHPATIRTYDDHRMAMSFALLGLRAPGIAVADPGCVSKTFPTFWDVLGTLGSGGNVAGPQSGE
jgi:3-phosphoshikimate 1-carboxyvinyltransferase